MDVEIKETASGVADYENQTKRLLRKKLEIESRMAENTKWAQQFDRDIGPFEQKYSQLVKEIHGLYGEAKLKHAAGLSLLIKEFQYHPTFKRWSDGFTAVPFKPA